MKKQIFLNRDVVKVLFEAEVKPGGPLAKL